MMKKLYLLIVIGLLAMAFFSSPAFCAEVMTAEEIFQKMEAVNPNLKDYSSEIKIDLKGTALILPINLDLKGKYFYKKPDKYKMELEKAPKFLSKYPQMFGWHLPELKKHNAAVKEEMIGEIPCWKITLIPKEGRGDIVQEEIWVNKKDYTFPRNHTSYSKGAFIEVNVQYRKEGEYMLFDRMSAEFNFPAVRVKANASASYENYKVNIGLTDEFFLSDADKKKLKEEADRKKAEEAAKKKVK